MATPICSHCPYNVTPVRANCCLKLFLGDSVQSLSKKACALLLYALFPEVYLRIDDSNSRQYLVWCFAQELMGDENVPDRQYLPRGKLAGNDERNIEGILAVLRSIKHFKEKRIDSEFLVQTPLSHPKDSNEVFDAKKVLGDTECYYPPSYSHYIGLLSKISLNSLRAIASAFVSCVDPDMKKVFGYKSGCQPRWWPRDILFRSQQYLNIQSLRGLIVYLLCDLYPIVKAQNFLVTVKKPGIEPDIIEQLLYIRSIQERRFEEQFDVKYSRVDAIILPCPDGIEMPTEEHRVRQALYGNRAADKLEG